MSTRSFRPSPVARVVWIADEKAEESALAAMLADYVVMQARAYHG